MKKVTMPEIKMPVADVNTHEFTLQALNSVGEILHIQTLLNTSIAKNIKSLNHCDFLLACGLGATVYLVYELNKDVEELKTEVNELKNH